MKSIFYSILLTITFYSVVNCQERDTSYSISGIIIDPDLTRPSRWANVYIINRDIEVQSDSSGSFVIKSLWPDTFFVKSDFNSGGSFFDKRGVKVVLTSKRKNAYVYLVLSGDYYPVPKVKYDYNNKWKRINADDHFSFSIPLSLKKDKNIRGIDSYVEQYNSEDMEVGFDYGYGMSFSETIQDGQSKVLISCKKAIISNYYYPNEKSKFKFIQKIDFDDHITMAPMTLWVKYISYLQNEDALNILYSISFP